MGCERLELQRFFFHENIIETMMYGSFNELCHFELLISAETLQKQIKSFNRFTPKGYIIVQQYLLSL